MSGGKPVAGETDFESMSHEEMLALLKGADHGAVSDVSVKLAEVSKTVLDIGNRLKGHVAGLKYEGEGGDAFREWSHQTANATLRLSDYADKAGKFMGHVANSIAETHSKMPALSQTTSAQADLHHATKALEHSDSPSPSLEKSAMLANARIESTRGDAASTMRALATSYVHNGGQINALKPPTFPPPAHELGKDWIDPHVDVSRAGSSAGSGSHTLPGGGGGQRAYSVSGNRSVVSPGGGVPESKHLAYEGGTDSLAPIPHVPDAHMEINSTAPPVAPPNPTPHGALPPGPNGSQAAQSGVVPPAFGGPIGSLPHSGGRSGSNFSVRPGGGFSGGRVPRFGSAFSEGTTPAGTSGSTPRPNGISGGRPVQSPSGRPPARLPRGTVVGGEEPSNGSTGRPMMGRGTSAMRMGGEGAAGAGRNGLVGGRRLASDPGGVVGRPAQSGKLGGRPFTQGGSGLVRDDEENSRQQSRNGRMGMTPRGGKRPRSREDERGGERPDYLTEDEETWQQGSRQVVPPVID
ncbi:WXG100 family type VII secretion target [Streptomyces montanisoli]|uniref:Uncharacterized protein n=1 Tax=Streptomyces montanisoli TaxID=2798581 RepID=A0A940MC76_9ACTN|nr:hypothetical protein [Streptomyces montanisoli]MBP0458599.1 hypothetical protein [Streptomyces montanisoli]